MKLDFRKFMVKFSCPFANLVNSVDHLLRDAFTVRLLGPGLLGRKLTNRSLN